MHEQNFSGNVLLSLSPDSGHLFSHGTVQAPQGAGVRRRNLIRRTRLAQVVRPGQGPSPCRMNFGKSVLGCINQSVKYDEISRIVEEDRDTRENM